MSSVRCYLKLSFGSPSLSYRTFQLLGITTAASGAGYSLGYIYRHPTIKLSLHSARHYSSSSFRKSAPDFKTFGGSTFNRIKGAVLAFGIAWARRLSGGKMHSERSVIEFPNLKVIGIPAIQDNYMYLVIEKSSQQAVAFDPVEPDTMLNEIRRENVTLNAILTTHHHWDHAGGNLEMVSKYKRESPSATVEVYGGDDRVDALSKKVGQGDVITVGSLKFHCLFTPCHTTGHICYYLESQEQGQKPVVFTGDTLFIAGCGRFFEGTADQMHSALIEKLGKLPPETLVCCGHEYTIGNLKFALSVEPNNQKIKDKLVWAEEQRKKRLPTIPSTIAEEKDINPFMRCVLSEIQTALGAKSAIECMGKLRNMKDNFKAN